MARTIPVRFFKKIMAYKGWTPYYKGGWIRLGKNPRAGVTLSFKENANYEVQCSRATAREILSKLEEAL